MRTLKYIGIILLLLIVVYFMGPKPAQLKLTNELKTLPSDPVELDNYVKNKEASFKLKPDNEARITWFNDSTHGVTEYSVVYLHGFSASQEEGDPVHTTFAKKFGCNLYLSRLDEHGIDNPEALLNMTAENLWNSAKEAYAIGKKIGKKVILIGTSTGGTLALKLAAEFPDIAALILLSPNISINDDNAWLLNNPWGLQIARLVKGTYNYSSDTTVVYKKYWYHKYRMESAVQLQEFLETTMKESTFSRVTQPVLMLYFYKNEDEQDDVVKVSAMKRMYGQLGTPVELKRELALPNTGDHVIGSYIKSKDVKAVEDECIKFGVEILKLVNGER